ncbi:MAG: polysaccharide deacetylase family protein [Myxococcales bacterium]|nr:polysaccharide deacetylase family protein [Myxococcales bacterium]MBL0198261.1 polysaccharide deacetylase family protein [Myxococcales bacterium]HQY62165.1 polysaccharide deacetylase family protein [Polyangiaceae bacterium]
MSKRWSLAAPLALAAVAALSVAACSAEAPTDPVGEDPGAELDVVGESNSEEALTEKNNLRGVDKMADKQLALTFDDGPRASSVEFAQWLKDQGIPSTFFMTGNAIAASEPQRAAPGKIAAMGHLIANHTYTHPITPSFARLAPSQMVDEIGKTDVLIAPHVASGAPFFVRTSGGSWSTGVQTALNGSDRTKKYVGNIYWDIGGDMAGGFGADWACWGAKYKLSPEACGDRYMAEIKAKKKGIVLLHDIHAKTQLMVKYLVPKLKAEGYTFVRLDQIQGLRPTQ